MLQLIKIRNFQSLKDVTLTLGNVTVIRGKSDVGKSALIRALGSFFSNSFNEEYAHNGNLPCGVAIQKDNRVAIGRRTTKGVEYRLDNTLYSKTAKKVPTDITSFLGIQEYSIDKDISFLFQIQSQFDSPFLLKESSTTVAKLIGRISNLNIVLMAMRQMYADQLEYKQELNFATSKLTLAKESVKKYSNVKSQEESLVKAKLLLKTIEAQESTKISTSQIISTLDSLEEEKSAREVELAKLGAILTAITQLEIDISDNYSILVAIQNLEQLKAVEELDLSLLEDAAILFFNKLDNFKLLESSCSEFEKSDSEFNFIESELIILKDIFEVNLPDKTVLENLVNSGNEYVLNATALKAQLAILAADTAALNVELADFQKAKVICPFSKLEMQEYCKLNMQ